MAQGGGRGWFHRRKPQPEPEPIRKPEPTRLEAYEAQQIGNRPSAPDDFDSLLRPVTPVPPAEPSGVVPNQTAAWDARSTAAEPADERFAPPSQAVHSLDDPGTTDVPAATADPAVRSHQTGASTASYDWDAATAAALSGETGPDIPHGHAPGLHHSDPDQLLEDIIREIVGDATAETVSSLHQPRIVDSTGTETQRAPVRVAETPPVPAAEPDDTAADPDGGAYSVFDELVAPTPEPPREPEPRPVPEGTSSTSAPPSPETTAELPADVSRETSDPNGGTPLADQIADETRRRLALEEAVLPLPASTRILTISNQKGGVGKTTSAVNLAAALARAGAKVLVIDLDPQGNASTALGVEHRSDQQSVYDVLVGDLPIADVVRRSTEHDNLDCVPATIHLAGAEIELVSLVAREQRLRRALDAHLAQMDEPYDYVFIDCPPSLGLLTINAFVAAREVLIPIQCEYYALEGLSQLLSNIELIEKHLNPELRLSTILLTMYDSRTNLAQQVAQEVRDHFPTQTLGTIIPRSVRVSEAPSYGQSVISYDYASSGSLSYREAAAEIAWRGAPEQKESD